MNFMVKDINGEEHGPVNEKELEQLVDSDLVTRFEPVKRTLMKGWSPAGDLDFLKEAFKRADKRRAERENIDIEQIEVRQPESTAVSHFENEYVPVKGGVKLRFWSFLHDLSIFAFLLLFLLLLGTGGAFIKGYGDTTSDSDEVKRIISERESLDKEKAELTSELAELKGEPPAEPESNSEVESGSAGSLAKIRKGAEEREKLAGGVIPDSKTVAGKTESSREVTTADARSERNKERRIRIIEERLAELAVIPEREKLTENKVAPSIVDDARAGYSVGDVWNAGTDGNSVKYVCIRAKANHAVWCVRSFIMLISTLVFSVLAAFVIIYPAVHLGLYACTKGMSFYGIFLSDLEKPTRVEVLSFRAFIFYMVSVLTLPLIPFFITAGARTPGEVVTKTRIIRISAKK